jgi:hypothetical protein
MRSSSLLVFSLLMVACAPQNGEPNSAPTPHAAADTAAVSGTVSVVGSAPVNVAVLVRGPDGTSSRIEGPLAEEIQRLDGAEVEVTGTRQADPMYGSSLRATSYTVRSVDGAAVVVGTVEQGEGGALQLRTEDGRVVRLTGGASHLRPGQKVWVQGPATLQVQSFGVIRP